MCGLTAQAAPLRGSYGLGQVDVSDRVKLHAGTVPTMYTYYPVECLQTCASKE